MIRVLAPIAIAAACTGALAARVAWGAPPAGPQSANAPRERKPPRAEWEIVFADEVSAEDYARQLEYFGIEIGAVSKDGKVEYISKLTERRPEKRVGTSETDYRLRIGWKSGKLFVTDRRLLARARIATTNKELWHYFPVKVQAAMAELEREYAGLETSQIRRTRFAIRVKSRGEGYEFVVVEQEPPRAKQPTAASASESRNQPAQR